LTYSSRQFDRTCNRRPKPAINQTSASFDTTSPTVIPRNHLPASKLMFDPGRL